MNKIFLLIFLVFFLTFFTIPVRHPIITSTFGESRIDHIHNGVDFGGYGLGVYSVLAGQIVFQWQQEDYPLEQSFGYGNYIILQHGNKYRSFYYHLQNGFKISNQISVPENFLLAYSGDSGHSSGAHLHFTISDIKENRILNPLSFMGDLIDTIPPTIKEIYFSTNDKNLSELKNEMTISSNVYLYIKTYDKRNKTFYKMGVNKIACFLNGRKIVNLDFNILDVLPYKGAVLPPDKTATDIFLKSYIYKLGAIKLHNDVNLIKIIVSDYNKNTVKKLIKVNLARKK